MEETNVSTPVETNVKDTSVNVELTDDVNTSTAEPETSEETAEAGNAESEKLYAGKYKTIEDFEKGYAEAQKYVQKAAEFEKNYNDLLSKQSQEQDRVQKAKLQEARQQGFNSVDEYNISNKVKLAEFEYYVNNINQIAPENYEYVRENLLNYYQTGNIGYLAEAKRYFPIDFVENATRQKDQLTFQLRSVVEEKNKKAQIERDEKLAKTIKTEFAEFIGDINENQGKAEALKMFCNANFITSVEDMKGFEGIYSQIAKYEREQAIKEYEAAKTIEKTKEAAQIDTSANIDYGTSIPTPQQLAEMSQEEYEAAVAKYGLDKLV